VSNEFEARESGAFVECKDGEYTAVTRIEYPSKTQRGDAVKWLFTLEGVKDKEGKPIELWAFSSPNLTSASKFGAWGEAVLGRAIDFKGHERVSPSSLSGKRVKLRVENKDFTDNQGAVRKRPAVEKLYALNVAEALEPPRVERCWCGAEATAYAPDGETMICDVHAEKARAAGA
jgi:hypothetical protein